MVIKNGECIMLTFLRWSAAISKGKVEYRKSESVTCYMGQQKMKCDWASECRAHGQTLKYLSFIQIPFLIT